MVDRLLSRIGINVIAYVSPIADITEDILQNLNEGYDQMNSLSEEEAE